MAKKKNHQKAAWDSVTKKHFVTLLQLHTDSHNGEIKGWSAEAWAEISDGMKTRFPALNFTVKQMKRVEKYLRNSYKLIKDIEREGQSVLESLYSRDSSIEPTRGAQQNDKQEEEDFSIERCIAEYSKLPLAERKTYDFKGVLEFFEYNEKVRKAYINFPKDLIHQRTAWLNEALIRLMIKKRTTLHVRGPSSVPQDQPIQELDGEFSIVRCFSECERLGCDPADARLISEIFTIPLNRQLFLSWCQDVYRKSWVDHMVDFKGVLELFEYNEKVRKAYINFPKDLIHHSTAWLNKPLIRLLIKKRQKIDNLFRSIPNPAIPTIQECMDEYEKLDECKGDDLDLAALLFEHPSYRELFITFDEDFKRLWLRQMLPIIRKQQEERKQLTARSTRAPLAE